MSDKPCPIWTNRTMFLHWARDSNVFRSRVNLLEMNITVMRDRDGLWRASLHRPSAELHHHQIATAIEAQIRAAVMVIEQALELAHAGNDDADLRFAAMAFLEELHLRTCSDFLHCAHMRRWATRVSDSSTCVKNPGKQAL